MPTLQSNHSIEWLLFSLCKKIASLGVCLPRSTFVQLQFAIHQTSSIFSTQLFKCRMRNERRDKPISRFTSSYFCFFNSFISFSKSKRNCVILSSSNSEIQSSHSSISFMSCSEIGFLPSCSIITRNNTTIVS